MKAECEEKISFELELKCDIKEISILQGLFGMPGLPEYFRKSFPEYKDKPKKLFDEIYKAMQNRKTD